MKAMSATLAAAQKAASVRPYVRAVLTDFYGDVGRLRYANLYAGAEADTPAAVTVAGDGSLVRARQDGGTLYTSRVADPDEGSSYGSWTSHGAVTDAGVALASRGSTVLLLYVDGLAVKVKTSTDHGATWGAAVTLATAAVGPAHLAAAIADSGEAAAFWDEGAVVYRSRYSGGSWGARTAWTLSVAAVTGLACCYAGDWDVVVTGEDAAGDAHVWATVFGDGLAAAPDVWAPLVSVQMASRGSVVAFSGPGVCQASSGWRVFFLESYGLSGSSYERVHWTTMRAAEDFTADRWREPSAFDFVGAYGLACAAAGAEAWLASASTVWRGRSRPAVDVTEAVVEAEAELEEEDGLAVVVLDADLAGLEAGELRGLRLELSFGAVTAAGAEVPTPASRYQVERVELLTGASRRLVLGCVDGWGLLERWRARRQFVWPAGTRSVSELVGFILGRAGLRYLAVSLSSAITSLQPAFTVHPGESGRTAVRRLLAKVPDVMLMRGGSGVSRFPEASEAVEYAYGPGLHVMTGGRYVEAGPRWNWARAFGEGGAFGEAFDFADLEAVGERAALVRDAGLVMGALAGARAGYELRAGAVGGRADEVVALVQGAQEVWDVVSVTDAAAGLAAAKRRVVGVHWRYGPARWDMRLRLGAP